MRKLLVVRHAIARDRLESMGQGEEDADRPLTTEGRRKMVQATQGLMRLQPQLDTILTSPLLRALQTAEILAAHYPKSRMRVCAQLAPEHRTVSLLHTLSEEAGERCAIVGHEPGLSALLATLLCGRDSATIALKKGGMAQLEFSDTIASGEGALQWLLTPKQLRLLGAT